MLGKHFIITCFPVWIMWGACWWSNFHPSFEGMVTSKTISSLYRCPKSDDKHWHLHLHCWVVNFASIGSNNFWIQFMKNMFFWFYTTLIWGSEETCQIYYRLLTNIPEAQACNMILGYEKLLWRKTQSTPPHGQPCNLSRRVTILQLDSGFSCYWIRLLSSQWN